MKTLMIALAPALLFTVPAAAQSLHETHERIWHPTGKTPIVTWRMRAATQCTASGGHHQAGKGQMTRNTACAAVARAKGKPEQVAAR